MNRSRRLTCKPGRMPICARALGLVLASFTLAVALPASAAPQPDRDAADAAAAPAVHGFEPEFLEHLRESDDARVRLGSRARAPRAWAPPSRASSLELVPDNVLVNAKAGDPFGSAQEEPSIAALGTFTVCAFNTDKLSMGGDGISAASKATPGASSWTPSPIPPVFAGAKWIADPVVTVNAKSSTWFFSGLFTPTGSTSFDGIAVAHGTFMPGPMGLAISWSPPSLARMGTPGSALIDKPWLVADSSTANLYLSYTSFGSGSDTIEFQRSLDGGVSWSDPVTIAAATPALVQGSRVAVGPDGEIYVAWFRAAGPPDSMLVRKSVDHGLTFGPRTLISTVYSNFGSSGPGSNLLYAPNFPSLAVDRSLGDHRGRVYAMWAEAESYSLASMGTGSAMLEAAPSGSTKHATMFTPGMVLRGAMPGVDTDTWSFSADAGKTYSFLVDSFPAGFSAEVQVMAGDTTMFYAHGTVPAGIGSGKPALTLFTAPCSGIYYFKLVHGASTMAGYRMKTAVTDPSAFTPGKALDQRDVRASWSDGGSVWSVPTRVNADPPLSDQVMPEVGVSLEGYAYAMWLDFGGMGVCMPPSNVSTARSSDGGVSWAPGGFVTSMPTPWWMLPSDLAPNQGDYLGFSAGEQLAYAWPDGREGDPDVFAASATLMPTIACAPDSGWGAGTTHTLTYGVANSNPMFPNVYDWTLDVGRSWPGLPASGMITVPPASGAHVSITFVVPDTAASMIDPMTFTVSTPNGAIATTCAGHDTVYSSVASVIPGPSRPAFALERTWPNPARGGLHVAFSLATDAPASVELLDLAGRRVLERRLGVLGAGRHELSLSGEAASLPVGVYALRLTQGGRTAACKVALLR
jgi:hypothetical protein